MTTKEIRDFIFENCYRQIEFTKESSYYSMTHQKKKDLPLLGTKLIENILVASNAKEYCKSYLKNKNKKLFQRSKVLTQKLKTMENLNIIDIHSVTVELQKLFINYPRL